jgi:uroporphyrinogen decarboxylase
MRVPIPTRERWEKEGLPKGVDLVEYFGLDAMLTPFWRLPLNAGPLPVREKVVLEESEHHVIYVDNLGAKVRVHKERQDFGSMQWLEHPVKDRASFRQMKARYDPHDPTRYPDDWNQRVKDWQTRDHPLFLVIHGPFAFMRDWLGITNLCLAFHDQPALIEEMVEFVTYFIVAVIEKAISEVDVDLFLFGAEDMAYKTASLISPQMARQYLHPCYRQIADLLRQHGVKHIMIDSDGHVDVLIPVWLEAGITSIMPLEIAAGMDPLRLREQYPKLGMIGGIDKRVLVHGRAAIEAEIMAKVPPLKEKGGYIPALDHIIPPDIPLNGFRHYVEVLREIA